MAAAMQRTFNTVELHEMILARLDIKTLLTAKKVSKQWRDVIATPQVQRTLQFEEVYATGKEKASMTHLTESGEPVMINPLALKSITANGPADAGDTTLDICLHPKASHLNMQVAYPGVDCVQLEMRFCRQVNLANLLGRGFRGKGRWEEVALSIVECGGRHVTIGDIFEYLESVAAREHKVKIKTRMISLRCTATGEWVHWK